MPILCMPWSTVHSSWELTGWTQAFCLRFSGCLLASLVVSAARSEEHEVRGNSFRHLDAQGLVALLCERGSWWLIVVFLFIQTTFYTVSNVTADVRSWFGGICHSCLLSTLLLVVSIVFLVHHVVLIQIWNHLFHISSVCKCLMILVCCYCQFLGACVCKIVLCLRDDCYASLAHMLLPRLFG